MAERKIGDVVIGIVLAIMIIGSFSYMITEFDSQFTNNDGYGSELDTIYDNVSTNYKNSDKELEQKLLNSSVFSIPGTSDVDTRGTGEVFIMTKNSPGTIRTFLDLSIKYLMLHYIITSTIILLVIIITTILVLRFFRPGGI